jgi:hypothetical protein
MPSLLKRSRSSFIPDLKEKLQHPVIDRAEAPVGLMRCAQELERMVDPPRLFHVFSDLTVRQTRSTLHSTGIADL